MHKLPLHAYLLEGSHHDCGEPLGQLQAEIAYGWKNPQFQAPLRKQFAGLSLAVPVHVEMTRSRESRARESHLPSKGYLSRYIKEAVQILDRIDQSDLNEVIELLLRIRQQHGRLFFLGVGGSAANASHAVNDFRKIAGIESYAPTDNVAELTARINDDGWETAYRNWLQGSHLNENDAVFVLSVGGGDQERNISANLVSALRYAEEVGASICGIVGRDGGFTARVADACIIVPVVNRETITPHTESFQSLLLHMMVSHPKLKSAEMKWESSAVQDPAA
jgi:D-sedoheptulose 7-phosphate isomerase